jgi:DNA-directed RNA polymerase specialized sigma24 family protein
MGEGKDVELGIHKFEKQLNEIIELLPEVVRQAYCSLNHYPSTTNREDDVQRIFLLLIDHDYHTLKSYRHASCLQTWLFTITKRHVANRLRQQKRFIDLNVVSDALIESPVRSQGFSRRSGKRS